MFLIITYIFVQQVLVRCLHSWKRIVNTNNEYDDNNNNNNTKMNNKNNTNKNKNNNKKNDSEDNHDKPTSAVMLTSIVASNTPNNIDQQSQRELLNATPSSPFVLTPRESVNPQETSQI